MPLPANEAGSPVQRQGRHGAECLVNGKGQAFTYATSSDNCFPAPILPARGIVSTHSDSSVLGGSVASTWPLAAFMSLAGNG